ncbi:L-seryl-tRNA(Ser) seleniumtransferase/D-glucosaminate-6-phosphate ammonia-lyase [Mobilisporobacter senegalensis]|uniref:L-seryl-tRNA(Ser) seleniumtransferase/D-glucosaminate-6-phosphate ammonia-lyase n=1 Tax=Mobilisporobacter senegalensis TaxID=1329262 RepID=A0A3N1Y2T8_9FIRM|nr:DgaE family pyridoxal phosphate-dependent ammonia lyase [Mobilisporobacter senegalensis]ROR31587.1 L-seryl-tRNA(Ser) seleniumtransferase/D-glucosaminate-6-phosphate ammonia-lyase [Mobilisporobacter senegalensis]
MSIYQDIGLKRVINSCGRVTILGVSTLSDEVAEAAVAGGQSYVVIEDLINRAGEIISEYTGGEDSCVASCASAAICLTVAGLISKGKKSIMDRLPDSKGVPNEIILQKGHSIEFGAPISTMLRLGGGVPIEVGTVNEIIPEDIEEAINEKTVALLYVKSHHSVQKGMVDIETMIEIAHRHDLPLIIDAAAEEDFRKYIAMGADLVVYSGAKALEATTSGFVTGKKEYIQYAKKQYHGIGRPMKIGKEGIMGLLKALDLYENKDMKKEVEENLAKVQYLCEEINKIPGLKAIQIQDEAGRAIYRTRIMVDPTVSDKKIGEINKELRAGDPIIYCRAEFLNQGQLDFDPRPLCEGDKELIVSRLKELMKG